MHTDSADGRTELRSGLAPFLRAEIDKRGITDTTFAERAGISKSTLSHMLGKPGVIPDLATLDRIARALGIALARMIEVCGFPLGGDDRDARDTQLARMLETVPAIRRLLERLLTLPADDLDAIDRYVRFYTQELQQRRRKG